MDKIELEPYQSRNVTIGLSDGKRYRGFIKRIDESSIFLSNLQYEKEIALPINKIISIRLRESFVERKKFFWNK